MNEDQNSIVRPGTTSTTQPMAPANRVLFKFRAPLDPDPHATDKSPGKLHIGFCRRPKGWPVSTARWSMCMPSTKLAMANTKGQQAQCCPRSTRVVQVDCWHAPAACCLTQAPKLKGLSCCHYQPQTCHSSFPLGCVHLMSAAVG